MEADPSSIARTLAAAGCIAPEQETMELIAAAGGDAARLRELVSRRATGQPLPWLTGSIEFCGVELVVQPGTYVPRWQTEPLARLAVDLLPAGGTAVDLCTGTGAIAAVVAAADPTARVLATELDATAADCARRNGVDVLVGNLDDPLPAAIAGSVDVLTAVVPYVPTAEMDLLPRDVREHEPRIALDGGPDGTSLLLEVIARAPRLLRPGGSILLEVGGDQPDLLDGELRGRGFGAIEVLRDEEGDPRGIAAELI